MDKGTPNEEEETQGVLKPPNRVTEGNILIYSIIGCPHCIAAKRILMEFNLPYKDIPLDNYEDSVRLHIRV